MGRARREPFRLKKISASGLWHGVFWSEGLKEKQVSLGTRDERAARKAARELLASPGMIWARLGPDEGAWSLGDLWARYCRVAVTRGARALAVDRQAWGNLRAFFGDSAKLRDLEKRRLEEWLASYPAAGLSAETAHGHRARCARLWKLSCELPCPFTGLRVPRDKVAGARRPFTPGQIEELLAALLVQDPQLHPLALLLAETGLRLGDGARLRWDGVDLVERQLTLRASKTGALIELPLVDSLLVLLGKTKRSGVYVWPDLAAIYESDARELSRRLKRVLWRLGWESRVKLPGRTRPLSVLNWHSFRHSFVQRLSLARVAPALIQSMTGHKSLDLVVHYSQQVPMSEKLAALRSVALKLPKLPSLR